MRRPHPSKGLFAAFICVCAAAVIWLVGSFALAEPIDDNDVNSPDTNQSPHYSVGVASRDITPDPTATLIQLHCYGDRQKQPATGVLDPLFVRALSIRDPNDHLVGLVSADLCYINSAVRDEVLQRLGPHGFTEHNLLLAGTHTHSGCSGYDRRYVATKFFGDYNQQIFDTIVNNITSALLEAKQKMQPARIAYAAAEIEGMNRSRRDPAFSVEISAMQENAVPDPERYPVNKRLAVVSFSGLDGSPLAVAVNFASHPTILSPKNFKLSADWPGAMAAAVQEKIGAQVEVLFFNGSLGDAAPVPDWADDVDTEIAQMKQYGRQMAEHVMKLIPQAKPVADNSVAGFTVRREFSKAVLRFFHRLRLPRFISKIAYLRPDAPFQAMRLGDLVLVNIPGEPTTALGEQIENACSSESTGLVVAPANGYMGYFVTPAEYEEDGYAADACLWGPDTGSRVIDAARLALKNLEEQRQF